VAHVDFTVEELHEFIREHSNNDVAHEVYEALVAARTGRQVEDALDWVNNLVHGHGTESLRPDWSRPDHRFWGESIAAYVNMGDTYSWTLLYDVEEHEFRLTSYGDFLEEWERGNPNPEEEEAEYEATLDEDRPPTWSPNWDQRPLIAVLRSVEGYEVFVHLWDKETLTLAFSVPYPSSIRELFYASPEVYSFDVDGGPPRHKPYTYPLKALVELLGGHRRFSVAHMIGEGGGIHSSGAQVSIEQSQWLRLQVALDSFMEKNLESQPRDEFLVAPPTLWTCDQLTIHWGQPPAINFRLLHVYANNDHDFHVRWFQDEDLQSLIEDGFIKWEDDESVREYLHSIGVCRSA